MTRPSALVLVVFSLQGLPPIRILLKNGKSGVKDSKLIAPKKREELAQLIKETASGISIMEITPQMIDDKSLNLNEWEMLTVLTIAKKLQRKASFEKVYIDNWEFSEKKFKERIIELTSKSFKELLTQKGFSLNKKDRINAIISGTLCR